MNSFDQYITQPAKDIFEEQSSTLRPVEIWRQDPSDPELWHGREGLIVNTAALLEREYYFSIIRVSGSESAYGREQPLVALESSEA